MPKGRPFAKGVSGNPGGRTAQEREVVEAIRAKGVELAQKLLQLALEEDNVPAIKEALDRGYGKAKQFVELSGDPERPVRLDLSKLTDDELRTLERIRERLDSSEE